MFDEIRHWYSTCILFLLVPALYLLSSFVIPEGAFSIVCLIFPAMILALKLPLFRFLIAALYLFVVSQVGIYLKYHMFEQSMSEAERITSSSALAGLVMYEFLFIVGTVLLYRYAQKSTKLKR